MQLMPCLAPAGRADRAAPLPSHSAPLSSCPAAVSPAHQLKVQTCFDSDAIPRNNFPGKMNSEGFF